MKSDTALKISKKVIQDKEKSIGVAYKVNTKKEKNEVISKLKNIYKEIKSEASKGKREIVINVGVCEDANGVSLDRYELEHLNKMKRGYDLLLDNRLTDVGEIIFEKLRKNDYTIGQSTFWDINYSYEDDYGSYKSHKIGYHVFVKISW